MRVLSSLVTFQQIPGHVWKPKKKTKKKKGTNKKKRKKTKMVTPTSCWPNEDN